MNNYQGVLLDTGKLNEIIDYAIEREIEAAEFYKDLQSKVQHESNRELLRELEKMELGHKRILESYKTGSFSGFIPSKVADLKISDYLVASANPEDMTFQDILVHAMKREEAAKNLYNQLSDTIEDTAAKKMFLKLSAEEAKHKLQLETLYDDEVLKEN